MNLMTIDEVKYCDSNNDIIWIATNLKNKLHLEGQEFINEVLFNGLAVPSNYYVGLDNRTTVNVGDILANVVVVEPATNGYVRKTVNAQSGFTVSYSSGKWKSLSINLVFNATGGSWGPVKNSFLTAGGFLISTIVLPIETTLTNGQYFSFRMQFSLGD